ncbi:hypothetical protein [Rhizobacter sp. SG703]|uniref:hypothetical protein n=1 Tax=Rhizobacter sp. SG703 TaxID=2587140 RepID=UPI00144736DE|nr:hypothetical protein [Rhizobacter sp. SG703]NKI97093.1 hypothetical protein [Rhizobacter sp. SG703]
MQELTEEEIELVSGSGGLRDGVVSAAIWAGLEKAAGALSQFASNGQPPNYGNTTPMGDMF